MCENGAINDWAGTGTIRSADGLIRTSQFGQPAGLAVEHNTLYVADSQMGAVRMIICLD